MPGRRPKLALAVLLGTLAFAIPASEAQERPQARIVGGVTTTIEEWPWQVALTISKDILIGQSGFERQICGGSLIAPDLAVTAAHCTDLIQDLDGQPDPETLFGVITGRTTLSDETQGREHDVEGIYYFTQTGPSTVALDDTGPALYDPATSEWDAVVVDFAGPAAPAAQPIQIAGSGEEATWAPGRPAVVTGWGTTSEGGDSSNTLREVAIEMLSDQTCEDYRNPRDGEPYPYDPQTMVCAGWLPGGRDTCQGDSGGPLVVPLAGGTWRLVGDTSYGDGCARAGVPAVYGRLAGEAMRGPIETFVAANRGGYDVTGSGGQPGELPSTVGPQPAPPADPDPNPNPDPDPSPARRCVVPGLRTKTVPAARRALRRRNCRLGAITRRHSARFRRGRVIRQWPPRGARRKAGFRVRIVVSRGPRR